ncbi:MAG: peptidylprolyl isomerase [Oscillospiraceae bacterium]|nr:peptidylprolyl isomerase [Oscillospiraceae bacterium]
MSASSKKKLRNAAKAEQLTEKQLAEQTEAKKLKIFTIVMVAAVALMVVFAIGVGVYNGVIVPQQAKKEAEAMRSTVAVTVGDHEVSAVEYNCFYVDAVSNFYSQVGSYASLYGLDVTKALDQQVVDEETGKTWADEFKTSAENNIKSVYAICDEAEANGFTLSEADKTTIESQMTSLALNALQYGYANVDDYLTAMYGTGANQQTVRAYFEKCYTASMYQNSVAEAIEYTDAEIQAKDDADPNAYTFFSYNSYYMSTSKFLEGGTENEDGTKTYSDAEKAAAIAAAEAAAQSLVTEEITSIEALDAAIAALEINAEAASAASTPYTDSSYTYLASAIQSWVADESRQAGDLTYLPSTTTDADGNTTVTGYYVVYFVARNENDYQLANIRHILAAFEGGTTDTNGNKTYSDEEKAAAREKAEAIYEEWKNGEATEDTFAALANEKSDDGDGTTGGLYTDVYKGQMVESFNNWIFAGHTAGETEIIESEFGYHIMYALDASEQTYREMMIKNTLLNEDITEWHDDLVADVTVTEKNMEHVPTGMVISPAYSA